MREFLWSEEMADASVHVLLNVDFKDTYTEGSKDIRNCHINVGTGKEISIREVAGMIMRKFNLRVTFFGIVLNLTVRCVN